MEEGTELLYKPFLRKLFRVRADRVRVISVRVKANDGVPDVLPALGFEVESGDTRNHGFGRAADAVGDHGFARGHGLDGRDAEVFNLRVNESDGMPDARDFFRIRNASEEFRFGSCQAFEPGELRTYAEDFERDIQLRKGAYRKIEPFISHESSARDPVALVRRGNGDAGEINRRVQDLRVATVVSPDASLLVAEFVG